MTTLDTHEELLATLEHERVLVLDLLPRFSDAQWQTSDRGDGWTVHDIVGHLSSATHGLALMVLGEIAVSAPVDPQTGWINPDAINEQLRQKNAGQSRAKLTHRMASACESARRAIEATSDLSAPGPGGSTQTMGAWLDRMVLHIQFHRQELAELLARG